MKDLEQIFEGLFSDKIGTKGKEKLSDMLIDLANLVKETEGQINTEIKIEGIPNFSKYIGKIAGKTYIKGGYEKCIMNSGNGDFSYYNTPPVENEAIFSEKIGFNNLNIGNIFIDISEDNEMTVGLITKEEEDGKLNFVHFRNNKLATGDIVGDNSDTRLYKIT